MSRHNVLLLIVDSLRADKFYDAVQSSELAVAKLIRERGIQFDQFYSVASTTTPCFGSILTGLYPTRNGLRAHRGHKLGRDIETLGQHLQRAGYHTAAHVTGPLGPETDLQRGFDEYAFRDRQHNEYTAFGSRMRRRLRGMRTADRPWFEFIHFWILHQTRRYSLLYRSLMQSETAWWQDGLSLLDALLGRFIQGRNTEQTYERSLECMLFYLDLLLREVDLQRTVVIVMGDHGEYIGSSHDKYPPHNLFSANRDHGFHVYDFLVRIPFVMFVPEKKNGARVGDLCSQVDIAPTVLEIAETPHAALKLQGRSLLPSLHGGPLEIRPVFFEAVGGKHFQEDKLISGVRFDQWKFIQARRETEFKPELFDLRADPHEENNLASQRTDLVAHARELLDAHYRETIAVDAQVKMSAEEEEVVTQRLKDLGYIE